MATFAALQGRVQSYLIDLPVETEALVPSWINQAVAKACERHNFRFMEATAEFTTAAGTRVLGSLPSDWKEARALPWHVNGAGTGTGATSTEFDWAASESEVIRLFNDDPTLDRGPPGMLRETETQLLIYPYPDENSRWVDGDYRVKVPYWKKLAELAADGDTNWLTLNLDWYVTFFAVAEGLAFNRDEQRAAVYVGKAEIEFKGGVRKDKLSRLTSGTFGIHRDVHATRRQGRSF